MKLHRETKGSLALHCFVVFQFGNSLGIVIWHGFNWFFAIMAVLSGLFSVVMWIHVLHTEAFYRIHDRCRAGLDEMGKCIGIGNGGRFYELDGAVKRDLDAMDSMVDGWRGFLRTKPVDKFSKP